MSISEAQLIRLLDRHCKSLCCNLSSTGFCYTKDRFCAWRKKDEEFSERGIICRWYREQVLPADKELEQLYEHWKQQEMDRREAEYLGLSVPIKDEYSNEVILCSICRKPLLRKSNRQKYCDSCRNVEDKRRRAARKRFERSQGG